MVLTVGLLVGANAWAGPTECPELPQPQTTQKKGGPGSEIRNMKIAFLTEALQLTPEQSQQFWPVYNEYWRARKEVSRRRHEVYKVIREGNAGEAQFKELLAVMDAERKVAADYMAKFRRILPDNKAARVFVADEDFKNFLVRRATGGGPKK